MPEEAPFQAATDVVSQHQGITRARLAARLGGRRTTTLATIDRALQHGVLCEGLSRVAARGGTRSVVGLYTPEAAPAPDTNPVLVDPADYLLSTRKQLRIPAHRLAAQLGVSESLIYHWETARQPVPTWAAAQVPAALEAATVPVGYSGRRRRIGRATAARRVVANHRGITVTDLAEEMSISRSDAARRVALLLERGDVHLGRPHRDGRRGARARGLYVGASGAATGAPTEADVLELVRAARAAGWGGRRTASALRISPQSWSMVSAGTRPLPSYVTVAEVASARRTAQRDRAQLADRLVEHVSRGGVTYEQLTRGTFGRTAAVLDTVRRLLDEGRLHYVSTSMPAVGTTKSADRFMQVLRTGPAPTTPDDLTGTQLEDLRLSRGLSRGDLAEALDVSKTQIGHWETGRQRIPAGRAEQLRGHLEPLPVTEQPPTIPERLDDADLSALLVAYVDEHPGSTAKTVTTSVSGGSTRRLLRLVRELLAERVLTSRSVTGYRSDGVPFQAAGLFPAESPRPVAYRG